MITNIRFPARLAAIGFASGFFIAGSRPAGEIESRKIAAVIRKHFPTGSEGGLAVLVIKDRVVIHSRGYGLKNGKEPITPQTPLGLASVTKQFAAMCAAMLIEEGTLSLSDPVSKHLPDLGLPRSGRELLVSDLVWHTSGLANFIDAREQEAMEAFKKQRGLTRLNNRTHAEWLATMPLRRAPGVKWEYTNSGYVLLARLVEVVSEMPFHQFQKERIFDVLGMSGATDSTRFNGSGNLTLSLDDYAKWDRALWDGTLLGNTTSKLLYQSGKLANGEPVGYGFGWWVVHEDGELVEMSHGGSGSPPAASRNWVIRDLRHRITVAVFARENLQFNRVFRETFAKEIRDAAAGPADPLGIPKPRSEVRARVLAQIDRMRTGKQPSVSGGSLTSGLLKHPAELPATGGAGYILAHPTRGSNFGNDRLVYGLMLLAAHLQESFGRHPHGQLCIRDLSKPAGGTIRHHLNHQLGLDADLTFYATDLHGNPIRPALTRYGADGRSPDGKRRFDDARNWEIVAGILTNELFGEIRTILISDPLKERLIAHARAELAKLSPHQQAGRDELAALIRRGQELMRQPATSPHDDHFHLSLKL